MFQTFANLFGYLLQLIYSLVNNYGLAIIIFTITIKILLLPLSIKQQKTMKKSTKLQEKIKIVQFKYKNDPEKMQKEMMEVYKSENMNPSSGCLVAIIQFIIIISVFLLVKSPLTYMQKISNDDINTYTTQLKEAERSVSDVYPQIDIIREYKYLKEKNPDKENIEKINIEMNFLGLDLSKIPQQNATDYTVYIIPVLYILSTFISMRITTSMQEKQNKKQDEPIEIKNEAKEEESEEKEEDPMEAMMQTNKMMSWMMPVLSISIALVAPLGLALYWLMNNILMIIERIVLDKTIKG